ncbi:MAG TPA: MerR family transcriptional regulator [Burkholderiaceae bacterium]|nr:MerR family transcriptional regulator [Burkholderiaceae bacterium]
MINTAAQEQFSMRTFASLTGMNAITLRAWERRYGLIRPTRTPAGHRLYTHEQVERIRRVLALVERGVPISRVGEQLDAEKAGTPVPASHDAWREHREQMLAATARFDEAELDRIYDGALAVHPIEHVTQRLLVPLLASLGERWKDLTGAIAEEHFFASYLRSKLGARLQHRMRYATGPRLLAACAPAEMHEIGLLLFAVEAQAAGMRTVVLGANTPLDELAGVRRRSDCSAVVLSMSVDPAPLLLEQELAALVREAGAPVFVGGPAAVRHRRAIAAAGAIPVGVDLEDGVRLITATLKRHRPQPRMRSRKSS